MRSTAFLEAFVEFYVCSAASLVDMVKRDDKWRLLRQIVIFQRFFPLNPLLSV